MSKRREKRDRLQLWQERLKRNENAYGAQRALMDGREQLYRGSDRIRPIVARDRARLDQTPHVRNLCSEMVESQVSSSIPQPKVTARRQQDEWRAKLIEDMLRNELDRLPFERLNDLMERTVPIQGGGAFLVEWDSNRRTHTTIGELEVSYVHPRQIVPQAGVYTGIEDMDYIILKLPQTKGYIRRRYGVDVSDEAETEPEAKGNGEGTVDDMVTQYVAYYRNDKGGIGLFSWVNDITLEDMEDYQARRLRRCAMCGAVEPLEAIPAQDPAINGMLPGMTPGGALSGGAVVMDAGMEDAGKPRPTARQRGGRKVCPYCGADKWEEGEEEFEEVYEPIAQSNGGLIPGLHPVEMVTGETDLYGMPIVATAMEPTRIPFYKPDIYPIILQENVSAADKFLGESDIDKIADQQNTTNRIESKIIEKLVSSGSYLSLPSDATVQINERDGKVIRLSKPSDLSMLGTYDMEGNVEQDVAYLNQIYEEARQVIGITDSFQGRKDTTATSGKAKEFSAAQSAGRLESKRVMKNAAYAELFEAMFKFKLAYSDEPRPVVSRNIEGQAEYQAFNRYDFLEQDAAGEWAWVDDFLFSCDTSAPLASNRDAMWQETRMNLESGAFGDPTNLKTLILFWSKMEMLHYPGAGETKAYLEEEYRQQQEQMAQQAAMQQQLAMQQARQDAARDAVTSAQERQQAAAPAQPGAV